jgi:hypothetical protein
MGQPAGLKRLSLILRVKGSLVKRKVAQLDDRFPTAEPL